MYINLTWNCRVCVGVAFLCLLCAFLPSLPLCSELINKTLWKQRWSTFFALEIECHNSYNKSLLCNSENGNIAWCNQTNSDWGLEKNDKPKNYFFSKNGLKTGTGCFFLKKTGFPNSDYLSILFVIFLLIARSGTSHVTISLIGSAPNT